MVPCLGSRKGSATPLLCWGGGQNPFLEPRPAWVGSGKGFPATSLNQFIDCSFWYRRIQCCDQVPSLQHCGTYLFLYLSLFHLCQVYHLQCSVCERMLINKCSSIKIFLYCLLIYLVLVKMVGGWNSLGIFFISTNLKFNSCDIWLDWGA